MKRNMLSSLSFSYSSTVVSSMKFQYRRIRGYKENSSYLKFRCSPLVAYSAYFPPSSVDRRNSSRTGYSTQIASRDIARFIARHFLRVNSLLAPYFTLSSSVQPVYKRSVSRIALLMPRHKARDNATEGKRRKKNIARREK